MATQPEPSAFEPEQGNEDVIENIRNRVARCRRLAAQLTDQPAIEALLGMALEGEEDIRRLEDRGRAA
ncbi:MAG: hypothetical protein JO335_03745 [Sphingomonas sp.]|nr:hypothetical protein [Sphingomonas sp.]